MFRHLDETAYWHVGNFDFSIDELLLSGMMSTVLCKRWPKKHWKWSHLTHIYLMYKMCCLNGWYISLMLDAWCLINFIFLTFNEKHCFIGLSNSINKRLCNPSFFLFLIPTFCFFCTNKVFHRAFDT